MPEETSFMTKPMGKNSPITISLMLVILTGVLYAQSTLYGIQRQLDSLRSELAEVKKSMGGRWTTQDMVMWEESLKANNPTLKAPGVMGILQTRSARYDNER